MSLFTTSLAMAEEGKHEENIAKHKAEIIANINQHKALLDTEISCVNAAKDRGALEKCRDQKMAGMEKLRQDRIAKEKAHLQEKIKKLDEKGAKTTIKKDHNESSGE